MKITIDDQRGHKLNLEIAYENVTPEGLEDAGWENLHLKGIFLIEGCVVHETEVFNATGCSLMRRNVQSKIFMECMEYFSDNYI